jgi:AhpC/TSA family
VSGRRGSEDEPRSPEGDGPDRADGAGLLSRLDPDLEPRREADPAADPAADPVAAGSRASPGVAPPSLPAQLPQPAIDTRPYRWMIGIFGLVLVIAISIYQFATHGVGTTGVPPGHRLHFFAAPLANTNLVGDANLDPPCTETRHDPRALNICLDVRRKPLVLAFFVTGSGECRREVDALQTLSNRLPRGAVQFAAIAVHASRSDTAALIRSHHWTIPVAYDRDGSVGAVYGVAICPMLELAQRGGIVSDLLIGDHWQTVSAIAPHVRSLLRGPPPA